MKKKFLGIMAIGILIFTGCGSKETDIAKKFKDKVKKLDSYHIEGLLEITNNETTYKYDIDVAYQADEKYRVSLKNKTNDHEQIILKNSDGVYVLTPALNKSFKFQSEWPYSNSQSYLYQTLVNDIDNDDSKKITKNKNGYIITTKVNYSNNKNLKNKKIYIDKNANIDKVEVLDKDGLVKIKMTYKKVDDNASFDDDYFKLSGNIDVTDTKQKQEKQTANLLDVAYPLYIPDNTKLASQQTVDTKTGERTILTFKGDEPFTIIEEVANIEDDMQTITVDGDLEFVNDVVGNITDQSVSWISNGVEYYAVSNTMDTEQLLEVVNSINVLPVGK